MKKLLIALLISCVLVSIGLVINLFSYRESNHLRFCIRNYGGEITIERGFGLMATHIYPMTQDGATSHRLRFAPVNLIVNIIAFTAIAYGLILLGTLIFKKRS